MGNFKGYLLSFILILGFEPLRAQSWEPDGNGGYRRISILFDFQRFREGEEAAKIVELQRISPEFEEEPNFDSIQKIVPKDLEPWLLKQIKGDDKKVQNAALLLFRWIPSASSEDAEFFIRKFLSGSSNGYLFGAALKKMNQDKVEDIVLNLFSGEAVAAQWERGSVQTLVSTLVLRQKSVDRLIQILQENNSHPYRKEFVEGLRARENLESVEDYFLEELQGSEWRNYIGWAFLAYLGQSTRPEFRARFQTVIINLGSKLAKDYSACPFIYESEYFEIKRPTLDIVALLLNPLADKVLDHCEDSDVRFNILRTCFREGGLGPEILAHKVPQVLNRVWPALWKNKKLNFTLGYIWTDPNAVVIPLSAYDIFRASNKFGSDRAISRAASFYTLHMIPALENAEAKEFAEAYLSAVSEQGTEVIKVDVKQWQKAWDQGGLAKNLAKRLLEDRIPDPNLSEIQSTIVGDPHFDEMIVEGEILSQYVISYLQERLKDDRFMMRGSYYKAIEKRWKAQALPLLPAIKEGNGFALMRNQEKERAIGAIYNSLPSPTCLLYTSDAADE